MHAECRKEKAMRGLIRNLSKTYQNKLCAIAMLLMGMLGVVIESDATALIFLALIALPMFFSREDWFN